MLRAKTSNGIYILGIDKLYKRFLYFTINMRIEKLYHKFLKIILGKRFIIFSVNLLDIPDTILMLPENYNVETKKSLEELSRNEFRMLFKFRKKTIFLKQMKERFSQKAKLWLLKYREEIVAFRWTIEKKTISPYFFPLRKFDVHFFDAMVKDEYRGQNLNSLFINYILCVLKGEGYKRVYVETQSFNRKYINSIKKTRFKIIGEACRFSILGRIIVIWLNMLTA